MHKKYLLATILLVFVLTSSFQQEIKRPPIWGLAKMTFLVSDFELARNYYGRFLGFEEAFSYQSDLGKVISFKVNDRQFLEFIVDKDAKSKNRLVSFSLETDDVEQMKAYLASKEADCSPIITDGAGNKVLYVSDPAGNKIEFVQFHPTSLHRKSKGRHLSDKRISTRIHHAGIYAKNIDDEDPFYIKMLGFKQIIRFPEDKNSDAILHYVRIGESAEFIEHFSPNDQNISHPCFLVNDIQETIYTLKERRINENLNPPMVGKGRRWILNISNDDKTKVEFTEAYTVK